MYSLVELSVSLMKLAGNILCPLTMQASSNPDSRECYVYPVALNDRREPTVEFEKHGCDEMASRVEVHCRPYQCGADKFP